MNSCSLKTPLGPIRIEETDGKITGVAFGSARSNGSSPVLSEAKKQLSEYFSGHRKEFSLPLEAQGTEFQKKVWKALQKIPFGRITTYGDLAKKVGAPKGARAVGSAMGKNPLPILVPCHRVLAQGGKIGGFSGGIALKEKLLSIEGRT